MRMPRDSNRGADGAVSYATEYEECAVIIGFKNGKYDSELDKGFLNNQE